MWRSPARQATIQVSGSFFLVKIPFLFSRPTPLEAGAEAPRISALDHEGAPMDLGRMAAEGITLVYFYPKADTPGCTAQGCSLRDGFTDLALVGITIRGVSRDRPEAQKRFREKFRLPYTLVADFDGRVAEAFGVPSLLGFAARQSFLIRDGRIIWITRHAEAGRHAEEVRQALEKML
jgi:peroxiredoxin Q/BCP